MMVTCWPFIWVIGSIDWLHLHSLPFLEVQASESQCKGSIWCWVNKGRSWTRITRQLLGSVFWVSFSALMPSVLWRCWLGGRKGIRPVKNWVVGCWCGYLSGAKCGLASGQADATATHLSLASVKSRLVLPFWYRLTWVVPEKGC